MLSHFLLLPLTLSLNLSHSLSLACLCTHTLRRLIAGHSSAYKCFIRRVRFSSLSLSPSLSLIPVTWYRLYYPYYKIRLRILDLDSCVCCVCVWVSVLTDDSVLEQNNCDKIWKKTQRIPGERDRDREREREDVKSNGDRIFCYVIAGERENSLVAEFPYSDILCMIYIYINIHKYTKCIYWPSVFLSFAVCFPIPVCSFFLYESFSPFSLSNLKERATKRERERNRGRDR